MLGPRTVGSGSSSLLPTPEAKLSDSGPDYARAGRDGSGGDDLTTTLHRLMPTPRARDWKDTGDFELHLEKGRLPHTIAALLPTPRATDGTNGGPNQRGSSGDLMLPSAVQLLPTPSVADGMGGHLTRSGDRSGELLLPGVAKTLRGARTSPPSADGNTSEEPQPQLPLWPAPEPGND